MELNKKEIRKSIIDRRDLIDLNTKNEMDNKIFLTLINSEYYKKSEMIFAFVSFGSEVDTKRFIEYAINDNKTICVPKVKSREIGMELFIIKGLKDLVAGFYGILEPVETCLGVDEAEASVLLDFILMPGVAFDRAGGRIGYGGGFYDRFLGKLTKKVDKIAIAYELQIIDKIPTVEFDISIDGIITENEIITFNN